MTKNAPNSEPEITYEKMFDAGDLSQRPATAPLNFIYHAHDKDELYRFTKLGWEKINTPT